MITLSLFPADTPAVGVTSRNGVSRATDAYNVHAYHTKVPPEAIEPFILKHTDEGQTVLDPFCGSGMTGVAARRIGRIPVLSDLSPAAVHIATNYTQPCDPFAYDAAVERVMSAVETEMRSLYATVCHLCGERGTTAYLVWSDLRRCPHCAHDMRLWDQRASGLRRLTCPGCGTRFRKSAAPVIAEVPVSVSFDCRSCGRLERSPLSDDIAAAEVDVSTIPYWVPEVPFGRDREMWRSGHDELGIHTVADFYSPRNRRALASLWSAIKREPDERLRSALKFTFTAIANRASRRYQWNAKRPTNVLGGTLYVSSLRYEFNVSGLWKRKVGAVRRFIAATSEITGPAHVRQASATALPYSDASFDYCFTDPPFGANIIYSDCSLLWEAWLGDFTDKSREAVINQQGKGLQQYADLMRESFREIHRVLKPRALATVVFQNTDPAVWDALVAATVDAGFAVEDVQVLHKVQPSFKGVKAQEEGERVAASDVVLTLRRTKPATAQLTMVGFEPVWAAVTEELRRTDLSMRQRSSGHLYAVAIAAAVTNGIPATHTTFETLEVWLGKTCERTSEGWQLRELAVGV